MARRLRDECAAHLARFLGLQGRQPRTPAGGDSATPPAFGLPSRRQVCLAVIGRGAAGLGSVPVGQPLAVTSLRVYVEVAADGPHERVVRDHSLMQVGLEFLCASGRGVEALTDMH